MASNSPAERTKEVAQRFNRRAVAFMERKAPAQKLVVKGGFTLSDLQCEISSEAKKCPILTAPKGGDSSCCWGPYCCDIIAPPEGDGKWQAIIRGCDGCMYAVGFEIEGRTVTLKPDPKKVESLTEYEYVDEMEAEERLKHSNLHRAKAAAALPPNVFYRYAEVDSESEDGKRYKIAFASEFPGTRIARKGEVDMGACAKVGEEYLEILSHRSGDYDFADLNNEGAFTDEHNPHLQIGTVHRALVTKKDKKSRASVSFDEASDLSKIRKRQYEIKSRRHVSVGYAHAEFVGDEKLSDGRIAKRFKWSAGHLSSVSTPFDPTVGHDRSKEGIYSRSEEGSVTDEDIQLDCLSCGEQFDKDELNEDFLCEDCAASPDTIAERKSKIDSQNKERAKYMAEQVATISDAEVLTRAKTHIDAAESTGRAKGVTDILARNKNFDDIVDGWIKDHGRKLRKSDKKIGSEVFQSIAQEFRHRDSTVPSAQLLQELGQRCQASAADLELEVYPGMLARAGVKDYRKFSDAGGLQGGLSEMARNKENYPKAGHLKEAHDDMAQFHKTRGLDFNYYDRAGFMLPDDAPSKPGPSFRARSSFDMARYASDSGQFTRDLNTGSFGAGGALVPTMLMVPIIELLRNRPVLTWAGVTMLGGLTGDVIIPRQTAACSPQALGELAILNQSQQTFDQIRFSPKRVGNTQFYSRLLVIQSSPDVEAIIREDNFRQIALTIDELGLNGTGAGSQPLGVFNTPGINAITFGGTVTLAQALQMKTFIRAANVNDPLAYITTSTSSGRLMAAPAALIGSTVVSGQTNAIWVGDELEGKITGTRAFASQQVPNNQMCCGAWEHFVWASWAGINVVVDYITKANQDEVGITMNTYNDVALRHPQAFTTSTDSAAQ